MLAHNFNYAFLMIRRPDWVPELDFQIAISILRGAQDAKDLVLPNELERDNGFLLLLVSTMGPKTCWLRFRWNAPYASDLTVVVKGN